MNKPAFGSMQQPRYSPWGEVQSAAERAPGIWSVSTAGHGGILISQERYDALPEAIKSHTTWSGQKLAFEEDQEWALIALVWPDAFTSLDEERDVEYVIRDAYRAAKGIDNTQIAALLTQFEFRVAQWEKAHGDDWELTSMGSNGNGWRCSLRRIRDGERKDVTLPTYPEKRLFKTEELPAPTPVKRYRLVQEVEGKLLATDYDETNILTGFALRGFEQVGQHQSKQTRPELQGEPTFRGLAGPMWDGGVIRYEDEKANDTLSR